MRKKPFNRDNCLEAQKNQYTPDDVVLSRSLEADKSNYSPHEIRLAAIVQALYMILSDKANLL